MAWYLRKSLNFGPVRFNLSKSGVGLSAGIKGLRVGTGPKGRYLQAGRGGLYYRRSLNGAEAEPADREAVASAGGNPARKSFLSGLISGLFRAR